MIKLEDLIRVAKRENNKKRSYLYVNPLQGKHIPVSPSRSMELFSLLARKVENRYHNERVLIIGFAETATAIGSAIAGLAENVTFYMNTTREEIPNAEYLFFTESHSHATEQRLVVNGVEQVLGQIDRIVFAEDEVTTGRTIEKIIGLMRETYAEQAVRFGIISVLNSMSDDRLREMEGSGVVCDALYRIPSLYLAHEIERFSYQPLLVRPKEECTGTVRIIRKSGYWNCRCVCDTKSMGAYVKAFVKSALDSLKDLEAPQSILVLGTEELMYPGMLLGAELEGIHPGQTVRFHATTRSPIEVSPDEEYPLHTRMPLVSVYCEERRTFLYNLGQYDKVLIVTDAQRMARRGLISLLGALEEFGNKDITVIQWGNWDYEEQLFQG